MKIDSRNSLKPRLKEIRALGLRGFDSEEIRKALELPVLKEQVRRFLRKIGVPPVPKGAKRGAGNHRWTGGRILTKGGYVMLYSPGHPYARKCGKGRAGYVFEHRLVMEKKLGRYLRPGEVVHHIDNENANNHPDNLELFQTNADHLRHELTGKKPKWTAEGFQRMQEGMSAYWRRKRLADLKKAASLRALKTGVRR